MEDEKYHVDVVNPLPVLLPFHPSDVDQYVHLVIVSPLPAPDHTWDLCSPGSEKIKIYFFD